MSSSKCIRILSTLSFASIVLQSPLPSPECVGLVLSITTLLVLPKEPIEVGKREDVGYSVLSRERRATLSGEGKWVGQLVSEEMLRQFGLPVDHELIVTERGMVEAEVTKFVDRFYSKRADPKR